MAGLFYEQSAQENRSANARAGKVIPIHLLNQVGCSACPLDKDASKLKNPKAAPVIPRETLIYVLGEKPSEADDENGEAFSGKSGRMLRDLIPDKLRRYTLYDNAIRCHTPGGREPSEVEIECCRGLVEETIARSKPLVVVGAGAAPLNWAAKINKIYEWRGRMFPISVRGHTCWYFPIYSPGFIAAKAGKYGPNEWDWTFEKDISNIMQMVSRDTLPKLEYVASDYFKDVEVVLPDQPGAFARVEDVLHTMASLPSVGLDIETKNLRPYHRDSRFLTIAIGTGRHTIAFPFDHPEGWNSSQFAKIRGLLLEFLLNSGRKVCHNTSFEQEWLAYEFGDGILRRTEWEDTLAQAHVMDERRGKGLGDLTRMYFGFDIKAQSTVDRKNVLSSTLTDVLRYNGGDSLWTHELFLRQREKIEAVPEFVDEYERLMRACPTLVRAQLRGVPVDRAYALELEDKYTKELKSIEDRIYAMPEVSDFAARHRKRFVITAPGDVKELLNDLGCQLTDSKEDTLDELDANDFPQARLILDHRGISKCLGGYVEPIIQRRIVYPDGLIHTNFNSMVTGTGRLSSDDPNLQNFPKRKRREVRGIVAARPHEWIVAVDYGQIEARTIAMASEDKNLIDALWTSFDIHGHWAARFEKEYPAILDRVADQYEIDRDDLKKVRKELRQEAKNGWVFPQFYGSAFKSCAASLKIPEDIAQRLAKEFWDQFKGVKKWQDKVMAKYERELYVETLTGRRRRGAMSKNQIINTVSQGTASDIVVDAMDRLSIESECLELDWLQALLNVHDDLTYFIPDEVLEPAVDHIALRMCQVPYDFVNVPILVEVSVGRRWDQIKEVGVFRSDQLNDLKALA